MTWRPSPLGFLFLALALFFGACEVLGVYEYVQERPTSLYIALGSCGVAAVTPGLPALADLFMRWRLRRYALVAWLGLAICLVIVITAAIQRTGTASDAADHARLAAERQTKVAEIIEAEAKEAYSNAQAAALKECSDKRGPKCLEAEAKADAKRAALARARVELVHAPVGAQLDPLARRLAPVLGLTEDQYRLIQPLQVPVAMSLLSVLFFAGWARVDFLAEEAPPASPPTPAPRKLELVPAVKFGDVAAFLLDRTEPAVGRSIEVEQTLYGDYKTWCARHNAPPCDPERFAQELGEIGTEVGMMIAIRGRKAYCLDRQLVA